MAINFLRPSIFRDRQRERYLLTLLTLLGGALLVVNYFIPGIIFVLIAILIIALFSNRLEWLLYALAAVSFFSNWYLTISGGTIRDIFGLVSFAPTIYAQVGDYMAIILGLAVLVRFVFAFNKKDFFKGTLPGFAWYGLFLLAALVSVAFIYTHTYTSSLKFWFRPLLFVYAMFVFLPNVVIRRMATLMSVLKIWFGVGVVIAVYGLTSIFLGGSGGWTRVEPFPIFGITPLGVNHNVLAEPLVAILPIALYFTVRAKKYRRLLACLLALIAGTALLTLSRAAWIGMIVSVLIVAYTYRQQVTGWIRRQELQAVVVVLLLIPIVGYMGRFLLSDPVVSSSDYTRTVLTEITLTYAKYRPWFGYGPGAFISVISDTRYFAIEFGDPFDSHGFIQKVLLEEGVIGLFFFVGFLVWVFQTLWQKSRKTLSHYDGLGVYLLAMAAGIVVFELFNTSYFLSTMWMPIGIALAGCRLLSEPYEH